MPESYKRGGAALCLGLVGLYLRGDWLSLVWLPWSHLGRDERHHASLEGSHQRPLPPEGERLSGSSSSHRYQEAQECSVPVSLDDPHGYEEPYSLNTSEVSVTSGHRTNCPSAKITMFIYFFYSIFPQFDR